MTDSLDELVHNARTGSGPCKGCPARTVTRADGQPLSEGVNPGLGHSDATVLFVTIESSPDHGQIMEWDAYDWAAYNDRYYDRLLEHWDSGKAVHRIIDPLDTVTTSDVWVADSIKCPPREGHDDQRRTREFAHCRGYLRQEVAAVDPDVVVALGNKPTTRTLDVLNGPAVDMGTAKYAGRRFNTDPPLVVSTSWSHGWLFDRSPTTYWGGDWVASHPDLQN